MEQVLHLFITNKCRHQCQFCCNKLYKISEIPVVTVELLKSVDTVCLTGGEPFTIKPPVLKGLIYSIRTQYRNIKNLYIYTSGYEFEKVHQDYYEFIQVYNWINGINIAPKDWKDWIAVPRVIPTINYTPSSNRLYVFREQRPVFDAMNIDLSRVNIDIIDRKWDIAFNTPDNEYFARLPILFE